MIINDVDIYTTYGIKQWNVTMAYSDITNRTEWTEGLRTPLILPWNPGLKKIKVSLLVKGQSRDEVWKNARPVLKMLYKPVTAILDGFDHFFYLTLTKATTTESSIKHFHLLNLEFSGYEYGDDKAGSLASSEEGAVLSYAGTMPAPVHISFVVESMSSELVISGFTRDRRTMEPTDIIITDLMPSEAITIDGMTGRINRTGMPTASFLDYGIQIKELPSIVPGDNLISCTGATIQLYYKYTELYL